MNLFKLLVPRPRVSVVIPTYQAAQTIVATVKSVLGQTYKKLDVLVVDDGSRDDIIAVLKTIRDRRLKIFQLQNHTNANVARNYGIDRARGRYIAFLDADDEWLPEHIDKKLHALRKYQQRGFRGIYGGVYVCRSGYPTKAYPVKKKHPCESMIDYLLRSPYSAQTSTQLMTTASARAIKFDPTLYRHQDYDFLCRYHQRFKMLADRHLTVIYNVNAEKDVTDDLDKKIESCIRVITAQKENVQNKDSLVKYLKFMRQHSIDILGPQYSDAYSKLIEEAQRKGNSQHAPAAE